MSGTILQNYPCHSCEDVIAALRDYNLNPLKHSFKTDSRSRPFETIGKIRRSNSNLLYNHSTNMGKTTRSRQNNSSKPVSIITINTNRDDTDWYRQLQTKQEANKTDCFSEYRVPAGEISQRSCSPKRFTNTEEMAVGYGDGENYYNKQNMKTAGNDMQRQYHTNCNSLIDNVKKAEERFIRVDGSVDANGDGDIFDVDDALNNHKEYVPTRGNICARELDYIPTNVEKELENRGYDMDSDLVNDGYAYRSMSKDVGVQTTVYHCNDCRRHLKYNQELPTRVPLGPGEPKLDKLFYRCHTPLTKERVFESEGSISTNTEEELESGTQYTRVRQFKQVLSASDQPHFDDQVDTSWVNPEHNKSQTTNKTPSKFVRSCDELIETDLRADEYKMQQCGLLQQLLTNINGYGKLARCTIVFMVLVLMLLASNIFMGSDAPDYLNLNFIFKYKNRPEEPKIEDRSKRYVDLATYALKSVLTVYREPSWYTFRSLTALFYH